MDIELLLVSKVLQTGNLKEVIDNKITSDFFYTKSKPVYQYIMKHYQEYKQTPSIDSVKLEYPQFEPADNLEEPLQYYIDKVREKHKHNLISQGLDKIITNLENQDLEQAETDLYTLTSKVSTETKVTKDMNYAESADERWELYQHKKEHFGIDGIPIGILPIDQITGGAHAGELITILGQSGVGKTWALILVAKNAAENDYRVLFITKEMEPVQIALRLDSLMSGLPFDQIKKGLLGDTTNEENYRRFLEEKAKVRDNVVIIGDDGKGGVTDIQAKIDEHNPDLVLIDGSYLLIDEDGGKAQWEKARNITQALKRLARRFSIPCYNTTQAGRQVKRSAPPGQEDVGFTYAYSQDSDVLYSVYRSDDLKESGKMGWKLTKVRDGADMGHFILQWDFDDPSTFGQLFQEMGQEEIGEDDETIIY